MSKKIEIYDTTLRDGSQQPGISFSTHDKLAIMRKLDTFGVDFIELGWPGANVKDTQAFQEARKIRLQKAQLVAFGMTCGKDKKPEDDRQLAMLLAAETHFITIVGKSSSRQVSSVLGISPEENLRLIEESCRFLVSNGRVVLFDAEHFFDGYKFNSSYSLKCLQAAIDGGASRVILCDTNGGSLPCDIFSVVSEIRKRITFPVGIHTHNDGEMAVANSLAAVDAGADQVQVTVNGYGERCGNANLCSVVPALRIKMGLDCISDSDLLQLTSLARFTAELANLPLIAKQPYVGSEAFRHKAGLHVNAVAKDPNSYNHIAPSLVGNVSSVAVSELSGRSNILLKAKEFGIDLSPDKAKQVLSQVESLENAGFQFEGADASLKLIMMRLVSGYSQPFDVLSRDVISRREGKGSLVDLAIIRMQIHNGRDDLSHEVADGDGPVNALDNALRKALLPHFHYLKDIKLIDYKVRVLDGKKGTAKAVRILVDFSDGKDGWTTVGCSTDSIEASLQALLDGFEYAIAKAR